MPVISFTVARYQIMEFVGKDKPVRVYLKDSTGTPRARMDFLKDYSGTSDYTVNGYENVLARLPLDKLHLTLDILRNEKPVYFEVDENINVGYLKTGDEPTGEEEFR